MHAVLSTRRPFQALLAALALFCAGAVTSALEDENETRRNASTRWGKNYFPNVPLITHEGETVHFFDDLIKDKVVVINFIYTSCPDSCPLETGRLLEVQGILGDRIGRDVFMYSISIDPEVDTPEVLAQYAQDYQVGPGWTFLTGEEEDITLLRKRLGLYIDEIQDEESNDHNLSLIIGNQATGIWMKKSPFENAYVLANQVGSWLHNWKQRRKDGGDYKNAPKLRNVSKGENLFRTRCSVCHSIGKGDGIFRVGPNLQGVMDRRDREWLERWLAAPDEVLASGDPIATELFESYNRVAMPNLRLNELEITRLLEYVETEGRRVEKHELAAVVTAERAPGDGASCCEKQDSLVIGAEDDLPEPDLSEVESADRSTRTPEKRVRRRGFSTASLVSIGMGLALGIATAIFRLRA